MGVRIKIEELQGIEDEKLAELISVVVRKEDRKCPEWWTLARPGVLFGCFYHEDVASDKSSLDVTSVISSAVPFKIVLQKGNGC